MPMSLPFYGAPASRIARFLLTVAAPALLVASCGGGKGTTADAAPTTADATVDAAPTTVRLKLSRVNNTSEFDIIVTVLDQDGQPMTGLSDVTVTAAGATVGAVTEQGSGNYVARCTPTVTSQEVTLTAAIAKSNASATHVAIVPAALNNGWDQPEAVPGFVNTAGWEDGTQISPDGQWLLVSSYSPVDLYSCPPFSNPASPACETAIGPYAAPERPGMLGAERIVSATHIVDKCPSIGLVPENLPVDQRCGDSVCGALPPIAAYGFRRRTDGSYAEPFPIGFAQDGCAAAGGYSFTDLAGSTAALVFMYTDPADLNRPDNEHDLYWVSNLTLGAPINLGTYQHNGSNTTVSNFLPTLLPLPDRSNDQGNPYFSGGRLWWNTKEDPATEKDILFANVTGTLPAGTIGPTQAAGFSQPGVGEIQPTFYNSVMYFTRDGQVVQAALTSADPAQASAWGAPDVIIGGNFAATAVGKIIIFGEPSIATFGGETWLYFVYLKRTATGINSDVGRVRRR